METETKLLEEWKANHDLLKFYEDLKQKRFAHFLTIQTAFLAFYALLAKDAFANISMVSLTALLLIAIPPLIISYHFIRVDTRGLAFVETTKAQLLMLEDRWKALSKESHFSTYGHIFDALSRHDEEAIQKQLVTRNLRGDPYRMLALSTSAHASEHSILRMFWWVWIALAILAFGVHLLWHMLHGFTWAM